MKTPIKPNQMTLLTLILALVGAALMATDNSVYLNWGAGLFALSRFLDHFDGELARQKGISTKLGYYLDYITGTISYSALFLCIGISLHQGPLGNWSLVFGIAGALTAVLSTIIDLKIDKIKGGDDTIDAVGYPGFAGFELEDGIYLIAPITWFGFLTEFFVAAGIGAIVYLLWNIWCFWRTSHTFIADEHKHVD